MKCFWLYSCWVFHGPLLECFKHGSHFLPRVLHNMRVCVFLLITLNCSFLLRRLTSAYSHLHLQLWRKKRVGEAVVKHWAVFVLRVFIFALSFIIVLEHDFAKQFFHVFKLLESWCCVGCFSSLMPSLMLPKNIWEWRFFCYSVIYFSTNRSIFKEKDYKSGWPCEPVSILSDLKLVLTLLKPLRYTFFDLCAKGRALLTYSLSVFFPPRLSLWPPSIILPPGLVVWAAALEGGSLSREPDPLGEPLHDPPLPEPLPARTRRHLRAGEQRRAAAPQRAAVSLDAHLQRPATGERGSTCPDRAVGQGAEPQQAQELLLSFCFMWQ